MAKKYGVSEEDIMKGAGITDPRKLIAGRTITVTNGGGSVSQIKQFKSTATNTDKSQSSKKNGGSQPPPPPEPPKKPDGDKSKKLLDGTIKTAGAIKVAEEIKDSVPEVINEAEKTIENVAEKVVSESGKIVNDVFNFTDVTTRHMQERGRKLPIQVLKDAIETGYSVLDPQNSSNAKMYYKTICVNNKPYNLEVLYDKATNTILHFLYTSEAIGNLPAIK